MYLFKVFFPENRHTFAFYFCNKISNMDANKMICMFYYGLLYKKLLYVTILTFYLAFSTVIHDIVRYSTQVGQTKGTGSFGVDGVDGTP